MTAAAIISYAAENILIPFSAPDTYMLTTQKLIELLYLKDLPKLMKILL